MLKLNQGEKAKHKPAVVRNFSVPKGYANIKGLFSICTIEQRGSL